MELGNKEVVYLKRPVVLKNLLKKNNFKDTDSIRWAYYGYGILNCAGECEVKDLPIDVKLARCFRYEDDNLFRVDGAL